MHARINERTLSSLTHLANEVEQYKKLGDKTVRPPRVHNIPAKPRVRQQSVTREHASTRQLVWFRIALMTAKDVGIAVKKRKKRPTKYKGTTRNWSKVMLSCGQY